MVWSAALCLVASCSGGSGDTTDTTFDSTPVDSEAPPDSSPTDAPRDTSVVVEPTTTELPPPEPEPAADPAETELLDQLARDASEESKSRGRPTPHS